MSFQFELTTAEKEYLLELARLSILQCFDAGVILPKNVSDKLKEPYGAFVTLKKQGQLRGCIGHIVGDHPITETIVQMAQSAAFQDPRFPPLDQEEVAEIEVGISILSPLRPCTPDEIVPGRHGLLVRSGMHSGLLLPQVAVEYGWNRETFLSQTCRKAGMAADCWRKANVEIFCFEAVIF
ncbi:AmmeMemoRadiSam system protein A [Desulfonatronum parangueonense]